MVKLNFGIIVLLIGIAAMFAATFVEYNHVGRALMSGIGGIFIIMGIFLLIGWI